MKPQLFDQITDILQNLRKTQIVVSVIAGKSTSVLSKLCGEASVTRIVLNTACLVKAGAITMAAPDNTSEVFNQLWIWWKIFRQAPRKRKFFLCNF